MAIINSQKLHIRKVLLSLAQEAYLGHALSTDGSFAFTAGGRRAVVITTSIDFTVDSLAEYSC